MTQSNAGAGTKSPSVEDYIKAIYQAQVELDEVSTQDIAARVSVSPAAVSKMLRRLGQLQLVHHTPYHGVRLSPPGEKMALGTIRNHRLLERYLVEALGYEWDRVHEEAERLEHHISEEFAEKIDSLLGRPTIDPHGDPIPTRDGAVAAVSRRTLAQQTAPAHLTVRRVRDSDCELLRYLKKLGLTPGTEIELLDREPFEGDFLVRVHDTQVRVAPHAASQIFVGGGDE
jgi:DtxR family Mn-dependent transcriptional regulator